METEKLKASIGSSLPSNSRYSLQEDVSMDVSSISSTAAIATMVRQLQTVNELQTEIMSQMVDSQQQLAEMLAVLGIGQNIDTMA